MVVDAVVIECAVGVIYAAENADAKLHNGTSAAFRNELFFCDTPNLINIKRFAYTSGMSKQNFNIDLPDVIHSKLGWVIKPRPHDFFSVASSSSLTFILIWRRAFVSMLGSSLVRTWDT